MLETISELNKVTGIDISPSASPHILFDMNCLAQKLPPFSLLLPPTPPPLPQQRKKKSEVIIAPFKIKKNKNYYKERQTTLSAYLYTLDLNRT